MVPEAREAGALPAWSSPPTVGKCSVKAPSQAWLFLHCFASIPTLGLIPSSTSPLLGNTSTASLWKQDVWVSSPVNVCREPISFSGLWAVSQAPFPMASKDDGAYGVLALPALAACWPLRPWVQTGNQELGCPACSGPVILPFSSQTYTLQPLVLRFTIAKFAVGG